MGKNQETYIVSYHEEIPQDIANVDNFWREQIIIAIEHKLLTKPDVFGKPLRRSLKGCRTLRVGDYRIVFKIQGKYVYILSISHRSKNYQDIERRM